MNTLTKSIAISVLAISSIGLANAANVIVPTDNSITTKLCVAATKGSKAKLSKAINDSRLSKRFVVENVKCNELDLVNFVEQFGENPEKMNSFLTSGKYNKAGTIASL
ncbi:DUF3718 domain-containing protein [Aliiglaciecola sp. 3_MG-2023]|uniref:DUF3718 domain-containing protein n=1 Tax=Aliiglaciecola sp. 3_MG-2023 TaxID=3062644 RepID=UPI0026E3792D|nr:DUF3718 domain-containing protein [Aliiglaciecola sp. 3_MG-2023]MDO6693547.1 DUF3718 domain-containing protein [Aliiglaciecola sp. 3_MG-2023]